MTRLKKLISLLLVSLALCSCASTGMLKKIENKVYEGDAGAQLVIVKEKFKSPKLMFHGPSLIKPNTNPEEIEKNRDKYEKSKNKEYSDVKIEERDEKNVADSSKLWPGFVPSPLTDEIIKQLELKKGQTGVLVTSLQAKSPAAVMSLQPGDLIIKVNGKDVKDVLGFYDELLNAKGEIWFDFIREGHNLVTPKIKR